MKLDRGSVILLDLDPTVGHEQRGVRPCVVVSDPRWWRINGSRSCAWCLSRVLLAREPCIPS
ncbi:MAG: type II toxin-antitoxin system PemK/MazF family toxin [Deltaproteobacteria bacterium]|nr:type II toxin-antitoxin system PemK/MazF family toxin [Deltaproteobacteria bacterium]